MDYFLQFLTDVLVPLAWPAVAIIVLVALKDVIREAIKRIVKAGPTGIEMSPQTGAVGATLRGEVTDLTEDSKEIVDQQHWGYIDPWLDLLERHLESTGKSNDIVEVKKIAAAYDRRAGAQYLLRVIYGTQYEALLKMLDAPQSLADLKDLYAEHTRKAGESAYNTPEAWLGWLTQHGISYAIEGRYAPTEIGKSLVDLIVAHGLSARENYG